MTVTITKCAQIPSETSVVTSNDLKGTHTQVARFILLRTTTKELLTIVFVALERAFCWPLATLSLRHRCRMDLLMRA
jgi:hypothetical protein